MRSSFESLSDVIDKRSLQRDLYLLVCLLLSDQEVNKNKIGWAAQFHETEVVRLLMWIAVAVRNILDHYSKKSQIDTKESSKKLILSGIAQKYSATECGEFWPDYRRRKGSKKLSLRQACNSIIHATEIVPYILPEDTSSRSENLVYTDRLTIRAIGAGSKPKRTWALLDAVVFAKTTNELIETIEEEFENANR